MKLTESQQKAWDILQKHGRICRYPGGYWNAYGRTEPGTENSYKKGSVDISTLYFLEIKGLIKGSIYRISGQIAIEFVLNESKQAETA